MLDAVELAQEVTGREMRVSYAEENRIGDHIWHVSDLAKLKAQYPSWRFTYGGVREIAEEIYEVNKARWDVG